MARWQLREPHYLHVPGTEWEYKEVSQETGKQARKIFLVPAYLDEGTIVCLEGRGLPNDIVIEDPPTPNMAPLDDEAREISEGYADQWQHPIESLPGQGFSQSILDRLQREVADLKSAQPKQQALKTVSFEAFAAMQAELASLKAQLESKVRRV